MNKICLPVKYETGFKKTSNIKDFINQAISTENIK